ncbi:hypothetical protein AAC387_Pa09g0473 [Persea americana]|eukprot:TRINITY_DN11478_c0_g1_i5.p1 TRINITY_DN11478_c0_g1~~TRINITY_DN11478_c0_g1_i5.p1  ORF type:complete len:145 (-),score=11.15 TRINITY_DN11478_c0_g1_i5:244-678(-)
MALFSAICSSFSSFNFLKNPVTNPPKISVSTSPHSVRPVTCNSNDPSSNGSSRIFIKGLPLSTTEGFLAKTFSRFGTVTKAKIITERSSKQSLGFAYVWFDCEEAAQLAVEDMDGKFVDGRFVAVTLARPESPTSHVRFVPYKF